VVDGNRALRDLIRKRRSLNELQNERVESGAYPERALLEAVNRGDIRVIQRGKELRLTFKPCDALGIGGEDVWKDFQRDVAIQFGVAGAIHLTHSAGAKRRQNFVGPQARACR